MMTGSSLRDQKEAAEKIRLIKAVVMLIIIVVVLTAGELSGDEGIPSWSDVFTIQQTAQQQMLSDTDLVMHFIDVGQGDATLVQSGEYNILIDAGENGRGRVIADYLDRLGIDRLDWIIATHPHSDHIGGMDDVLYRIKTDNVMMPALKEEYLPEYSFYTSVMSAIDATGVPVMYVNTGDQLTLGMMTVTVLGPDADETRDDVNDLSMRLIIRCGGAGLLTCGDITYEVEEEMLEEGTVPHATVLHINHHGSALSNTAQFVLAAHPQYAVISCGTGNSYGHPHDSVVKMLENMDIDYFRTDIDGTVIISCTAEGINAAAAG